LFALVGALALAAVSGLINSKTKTTTKTAHGVVSIANKADYVTVGAGGCHGTGNFTDISTGGTVTINDANGNPLATANLSAGSVDPNGFCAFAFDVPVRTGRGPYQVQITRRTAVQVNESDLFSLITLTLGA
jgi:hypothetical protein